MIKANELRIGNLVFEGFDVYEVTSITRSGQLRLFSAKENHSSGTSKIKPIPLTEEWLVRFGFKKHYDNEFLLGNYSIRYGLLYYNGYRCHEIGINSVHQLQNLYFALTGQELHP